jgi:hypothetical protein
MRFIQGLIVGAVLVILAAYIHDTLGADSTMPLVNWPRVSELRQDTFDFLREQVDRVTNWLQSK